MANSCTLAHHGVSGTLSDKYANESVTEKFFVHLDTPTRNIVSVVNSARAANSSQFPLRGEGWPANPFYGLFAKQFNVQMRNNLGTEWEVDVTYQPREPKDPDTQNDDNPLNWPPVYTLEFIEYEEAVTEAKNVDKIGDFAPGGPRDALTLGPVVNSALQEFDEGLFVPVRDAVIVITKNVATLDEVLAVDTQFLRTTNSDTIYGVGPRRFKYLGVESGGLQTANGIQYYTRTIKVQKLKTTDSVMNNVGWNYASLKDGKRILKPFTVKDDDDNDVLPSEPQFLNIYGGKPEDTDEPTVVRYRYLDEVPYQSLLN